MMKRCSSRWPGAASWPKATFTDMQGGDDNFADAFTDYVTVFNIRPAQCEFSFRS